MVVTDVNDANDTITRNRIVIKKFIDARITETNIAQNTQKVTTERLNNFSRNVKKDFKEVTHDDIVSYLNKLRKVETIDPNHKWIGTYNYTLTIISAFYKWLYYPNIERKKRPTPDVLLNIPKLNRKEKSTYKPSDMWTQDDDLLFLKHCPSIRDRCYHAMSRDLSCRPSELLKLKIKDIDFKVTENGQQYAEIVLNGKTGNRPIPLINSIRYVKDWLDSHPQRNRNRLDAWLICHEKKFTNGLTRAGMYSVYKRYKTKLFPSLLRDPLLDSDEKAKIQELLKKPWNPYTRRHSALTEKAKLLPEHVLRQHAGWTPDSNMHQKYIHFLGNESSESILEVNGLIKSNKQEIDKLKPMICPNCAEPNKIDSKFCANPRCKTVLTVDAYIAVSEENRQSQTRIERLEKGLAENTAIIKKFMAHTMDRANRSFALADSLSEMLERKFGIVTPSYPRPNFVKNEEYYKEREEMDTILEALEQKHRV